MKYVKKFETSAQFNNFVLDSTNTPNVSLVEELISTTGGLTFTPYIQNIHDYSQDYFTIELLDDTNSIQINVNGWSNKISYSLDNGTTWSEPSGLIELENISNGSKILLKGNTDVSMSSSQSLLIEIPNNERFNVEGNIMSLYYGDNFTGVTTIPGSYAFYGLFANLTSLINAGNLILPATTLADNCYDYMFGGCTNLLTAPILPATTLVYSCYSSMFSDCTSLTTAPELPATTLANGCYQYMFNGCSSLNYIKCLATDISASDCLNDWVNGVASSGTFVKDSSMSSWPTGTSGIPTGWTVQDD